MPKVKTSYKPGQSGNPKGRPPKGTSLTELTKEYLEEIVDMGDGDKKRRKEYLVSQTFNLMLKGDSTAMNIMWNRHDGLLKQAIEIETPESATLKKKTDMLDKILKKSRAKHAKARKNKTKSRG